MKNLNHKMLKIIKNGEKEIGNNFENLIIK